METKTKSTKRKREQTGFEDVETLPDRELWKDLEVVSFLQQMEPTEKKANIDVQTQVNKLKNMPAEMQLKLLSFLPLEDLLILSRTSSDIYDILKKLLPLLAHRRKPDLSNEDAICDLAFAGGRRCPNIPRDSRLYEKSLFSYPLSCESYCSKKIQNPRYWNTLIEEWCSRLLQIPNHIVTFVFLNSKGQVITKSLRLDAIAVSFEVKLEEPSSFYGEGKYLKTLTWHGPSNLSESYYWGKPNEFSSPQKFLDQIKQFLQDQRTQMISFSLSFRDPEEKKELREEKDFLDQYVYLRKLYIKWRSWAGETYFYAFLKNQPYYLPGLQISEFLLSNFDRYNPATITMSWDPRWRTFRHSEIIQEKHY